MIHTLSVVENIYRHCVHTDPGISLVRSAEFNIHKYLLKLVATWRSG